MNEKIFDRKKIKTFSNCKDLVKSMVGTREGVIVYNEKFRIDLENTCYKASICEYLQKQNTELKEQILLLKASEPMLEFAKQTYKDNWNKLKTMIQTSIIATEETAKEPDSEFITTIKGTFGRVLNMMQELEGKSE